MQADMMEGTNTLKREQDFGIFQKQKDKYVWSADDQRKI